MGGGGRIMLKLTFQLIIQRFLPTDKDSLKDSPALFPTQHKQRQSSWDKAR